MLCPGVLQGLQHGYLLWLILSQGCREICSNTSFSSVLAVCFSHFSPHIWAVLFSSSPRLSLGTTIVSLGLSRALKWVLWILLELAVSSMGQPQPLLTEALAAS